MRIPVRTTYMKSMLFLMIGVLFLISAIYSRMNTHASNTYTKSLMDNTRQVLSDLNARVQDIINANYSIGEDSTDDSIIAPPTTTNNNNNINSISNDNIRLPVVPEKDAILIDRRIAEEVSKKVRLLCWIPTRQIYERTRLKAVNATWAKRCDKTIYFMSFPKNKTNDVIGVNITDSRRTLTEKTVYAHKYLYEHYLDQFDWFLKADDDTYVIVENLKFLLSHFNLTTPGYIGCQFKHFAPQGYMSGGAGYAFNALGIRTIVENGYNVPGRCRLGGGAEDIETGRCAYKAGILTLDQLDVEEKQTFLPSNIYANALGPVPGWVASYMRAKTPAGLFCCSPLLVSFHYTGEKLMYATEFLLYRVVVHGRHERDDVKIFAGSEAKDMDLAVRRRPYPGETLAEYYEKGWRKKNTTIYINPNV